MVEVEVGEDCCADDIAAAIKSNSIDQEITSGRIRLLPRVPGTITISNGRLPHELGDELHREDSQHNGAANAGLIFAMLPIPRRIVSALLTAVTREARQ
jgi:hypothetical protein